MSTTELIAMIERLPADKQKEVEDFVLQKIDHTADINYQQKTENPNPIVSESVGRGYGSLKGKIWMSDDFNEPLEDFKDYI